MPDILLCRQQAAPVTDADREAIRRVVFGVIDGLGEIERAKWRRFWRWLLRLEAGEVVHVSTRMERSSPYHRRHFAIVQAVFEAQERFVEFEQFRVWLKIGAGWVEWIPAPHGGLVPLPRSVSYRAADQSEFADFHEATMRFLRDGYAASFLWPHLAGGADAMMDALLLEFDE